MLSRSVGLIRSNLTTIVRNSHATYTVPGENLPFQIKNRYKLTAMFVLFFGSGLGVPFLVLRHQLLKK
ncbi:cytochrome c oxidase subunit 7C, mitochondrial-like [Ctenocephalides felis]|uniref:cytochrome c oxidase subunit 7C, mitochondrial-like n=1 Tax=Ctenocephalides felis TaxID=7515 RepID=UPI000E6E470E|nr:cytochrome c oxidase subunit 7C, mitochondrial-like [Ctenocephalides felis]